MEGMASSDRIPEHLWLFEDAQNLFKDFGMAVDAWIDPNFKLPSIAVLGGVITNEAEPAYQGAEVSLWQTFYPVHGEVYVFSIKLPGQDVASKIHTRGGVPYDKFNRPLTRNGTEVIRYCLYKAKWSAEASKRALEGVPFDGSSVDQL